MAKGALPGFRDFYPDELAQRAYIMRAWRDVARRYAFVEYDGPPLEPLELYTRKSGEEIVGQLYNFSDKGGRDVALRPEMTPTFARMVAARANALRKPVRWFSVPQLFRYERQQKGRLREHYQLNVDIVGEAGVAADAELLAVAVDMLRALGLGPDDFVARVSDRRLWRARFVGHGLAEEQLPRLFAIVDKIEREPREVTSEKLAGMGLDAATIDAVFEFVQRRTVGEFVAAYHSVPAMSELLDQLRRYAGYLDALGVGDYVHLDTTIVRGLAYYTGIVFELFDAKGEFRAICGGGRYDDLLGALGGVDLPALGFGMGDVVLGDLLRARGLMPPFAPAIDYWIATADEAYGPDVLRAAATLRARGRSVEYALRPQSVDKQRKAAQAAGARQFIVLDARFAETGLAQLRTLARAGTDAGAPPGTGGSHGGEPTIRLDEWLQHA